MHPKNSTTEAPKPYPTTRKPNRPSVARLCQFCGNPFVVKQSEIDKGRNHGVYCSRVCMREGRSARWAASRADRFWAKVERGPECWLWRGFLDKNGYGKFNKEWAHRVAYKLGNGPITDGLLVLHRCDNPPCVNPAHLFLGTYLDNSLDIKRKGRGNIGAKHGLAKLTDEAVTEIRRRYADEKATQSELAAEFGVVRTCISLIVTGRAWRHLARE